MTIWQGCRPAAGATETMDVGPRGSALRVVAARGERDG